MKIDADKRYLVNTDNWFFAPDGEQYKCVWGEVKLLTTKEVLGFDPRRSTNWFLQIGNVFIAGCQVHFVIECPEKPIIKERTYIDKDTNLEQIENRIYIPNAIKDNQKIQ